MNPISFVKAHFILLGLIGIVVLGVAVRLVMGSLAGPGHFWEWIQLTYLELGANLAAGRGYWVAFAPGAIDVQATSADLLPLSALPHDYAQLQRPIQYYLPGYAYLIAPAIAITGRPDWAVPQGVNALLDGAFGPLIAYVIVARAGARQISGLLASGLYAVSPGISGMAAEVMPDSLSTLLSLVPMACVALSRQSRCTGVAALAAGVSIGLGCMFRGEIIALLPFAAALVAIGHVGALRVRLALAALVLVGWLVGTAPLALFWNQVYGYPALSRPGLGVRLWEGIGLYPNPWNVENSDEAAGELLSSHGLSYGTPDGDAFLVGESIQHFRESPYFLFRSVAVRGRDVARFGLDGWGDWSPVPYPRRIGGVPVVPFGVLIVVGLIATLLRARFLFFILACAWLARVVPFSLMEVQARDLMPVEFATLAWAACGAAALMRSALELSMRRASAFAGRAFPITHERVGG